MSETGNVAKAAGTAAKAAAEGAVTGIEGFLKLIKDFNVIGFVLGFLIGNGVAELAQAFIDGIVMPTAQPVLDRISTEGAEIRIGAVTLHLQKFLKAFFKFLVLAILIYILIQFGIQVSKPVTWVKIVK